MIKRSVIALVIALTLSGGVAWALDLQPGTYVMEWSILHIPVSSDLPDLTTGSVTIQLEHVRPGDCPAESVFIVRNAPSTFNGTITWCIKADGTFDAVAGTMGEGGLVQYTSDVFYVMGKTNRGNDTTLAVARRDTPPPPPPPGAVKVFITQPHNNDTIGGTVWVVMWAEKTTGSSNAFTLSADGRQVKTETTSSRGPVTIPWDSRSVPNGTHTLRATVVDASGNVGFASITVIVRN